MCGRYILAQAAAAERYFRLRDVGWRDSYNIVPTQSVATVRVIDGERRGDLLRWGLIPFFAHGVPPKYRTVNAIAERLESGPTWRGPWKRAQRCILPASGFYEWQARARGKQPYAITVCDQPVFGFAGLWDRSVALDGTAIESCTIITLPASPLMAEIHNTKKREPAILAAADHEAWLTGTPDEARATLKQYPDELLHAYPISLRVNSPHHNDPALLDPM